MPWEDGLHGEHSFAYYHMVHDVLRLVSASYVQNDQLLFALFLKINTGVLYYIQKWMYTFILIYLA